MIYKHKFLFLYTFLLLIFIISPSFSEPVRITVWNIPEFIIFHGTKEAIKEFERRTGIIVEIGSPGNMEDQQKLMTAIASKTPPDLIWQDRFTMGSWANRGAFITPG